MFENILQKKPIGKQWDLKRKATISYVGVFGWNYTNVKLVEDPTAKKGL